MVEKNVFSSSATSNRQLYTSQLRTAVCLGLGMRVNQLSTIYPFNYAKDAITSRTSINNRINMNVR
jgi:hypothetical protein